MQRVDGCGVLAGELAQEGLAKQGMIGVPGVVQPGDLPKEIQAAQDFQIVAREWSGNAGCERRQEAGIEALRQRRQQEPRPEPQELGLVEPLPGRPDVGQDSTTASVNPMTSTLWALWTTMPNHALRSRRVGSASRTLSSSAAGIDHGWCTWYAAKSSPLTAQS